MRCAAASELFGFMTSFEGLHVTRLKSTSGCGCFPFPPVFNMNNFIQLHSTSIIAGFLVDYITMRICTASAELACRGEDAFSFVLNQLTEDRPSRRNSTWKYPTLGILTPF